MKYYTLEDNDWWFISRRDMILKLVMKFDKNSRVLDIGCSGGATVRLLERYGFNDVRGIDNNLNAVKAAKAGGSKNIFHQDGTKTDFSGGSFDVVIASDVLEHICDDLSALKEWKRILAPHGSLIIFVPAFDLLWRNVDKISGHHRRYSRPVFLNLLQQAGFKVSRYSHWNVLLALPALIEKLLKMRTNPGSLNRHTNAFLGKILLMENVLIKKVNSPVGVSIFAVATADKTTCP
jgi:SAM-dependent methyltransferase